MVENTPVEEAVATKAEQQQELSLLDRAVQATKTEDRSYAEKLLQALTQEALDGTVQWNKNLTYTINNAIKAIDKLLSKQITEILHDSEFQKLEGSWRGLHYLVKNSLTGTDLKIRVLNVDKKTLAKNLDKAVDFDQSDLFKKIYEDEYGTPGGSPYGMLVGDYEIDNKPTDISFIENISGVAAAAFCPFITSAGPGLLGLDSWEDLSKPHDVSKIYESPEFARWNGYRNTEDSRFVTLALPRTLARLPYGADSIPIEAFNFEELPLYESNKSKQVGIDKFTWMNTAYVLAARCTEAFAEFGWCTAIRGAEGGGKVTGLPTHTFVTDDGDLSMQCPTEIAITDRREAELSKAGFLALSHYKNTDYAVFFGAQTTQRPQQYDDPDATSNAEISARLPYLMAVSRFAHYLKVMGRDKIGSFATTQNVEDWLNNWITNYVNSNPDSGQLLKSRYPLAAAKVEVKEVPGKPGSYQAVAWLQPWLQLEELTTSLRLVANIPAKG